MTSKVILRAKDDKLLRLAAQGLSPEQMSAEMGTLTPEECAARVKFLLRSTDIYTPYEEVQLLIESLSLLKGMYEENPGLLQRAAQDAMAYAKVCERYEKALDMKNRIRADQDEKVTAAQGRKLMELVKAGYYRARDLLKDQYPAVPIEKVDEAFQIGLREAAMDDGTS